MKVGTLRVRVVMRGSRSLKDKRRVVKSVKDRVRNRFNASIAEVGDADNIRVAELGVAVVANDRTHIDSALSHILNLIGSARGAELVGSETEVF